MESSCPKCPKCCSSENTYLFCKECDTYYCLVCCKEYYNASDNKETQNIVQTHNPHCNYELSPIELSDYED